MPPNISIYPFAQTERPGFPFNGAGHQVRGAFPRERLPGAGAGVLVDDDVFETSGFFVANPMERYTLGNRSNLQYEETVR